MTSGIFGEKILIIEDNTEWAKSFEKLLKQIHETRAVEIYHPSEFYTKFQRGADFDHYALCLTDLELRGDSHPLTYNDIDGLTHVLPKIRSTAPWLPTGCVSRFIHGESPILGQLSSSDFDFFRAKSSFLNSGRTHPEFNPQAWQQITKGMHLKRISSLTGQSINDLENRLLNLPSIEADLSIKTAWDAAGIDKISVSEAIVLLNIVGSEVFIESLEPGFSGLNVCKITAQGNLNGEPINAYWLAKWGQPISKLSAEATAHRALFQRGINRNLQIPQFYSNAISWGGIGYILYAFEKNANSALKYSIDRGFSAMTSHIDIIARELYSSYRPKTVSGTAQVTTWVGTTEKDLQNILNPTQKDSFEISWAPIHGDLHLRNIFINEHHPTLIDFARADFGPIAIDAAKLLVDCIAFGPPTLELPLVSPSYTLLQKSSLSSIITPFIKYLSSQDDIEFYCLVIKAYATKYIKYSDVPYDRKVILQSLIKLSSA